MDFCHCRAERSSSACRQADSGKPNGFSLIELIGVLAILVIVATLVLPKIWKPSRLAGTVEAVNRAHIEQTLASLQALKTAVTQHLAQFGTLACRKGTPLPVPGTYDGYDAILLSEQLLDRPFAAVLGSGTIVRLVNVSRLGVGSRVDAFDGAYDLDGRGANSITGASYVLEVLIRGLSDNEAKALNDALDGPSSGGGPGGADWQGRVIYGPGTPHEVHIFVTRQ